MPAKKATHKGHCQICNSLQKLPGDKLSKHGYIVQWNSFNGVCSGAKELPFEQSCEVLKEYIQKWKNEVAGRKGSIQTIMNAPVGNKAWQKEYSSRIRDYAFTEVELYKRDNAYYYLDAKGVEVRFSYAHDWTMQDMVMNSRKDRIRCIEQSIKEIERYIERLQARVDTWKPSELLPL
jgi:hypothetical protein